MHANPWWKTATIYQIYPKSFRDTTQTGTGDLPGIIEKLDYFSTLGIDALWLTPIYVSPQVDNGYDIADYYAIDPSLGTMDDFDTLLAEAHKRDIRIIMDIVINHTSTEHPWFQSALASKDSPYRDYYIWKDPVNGGVPNNWQSKFGGSAWQWHEPTGQYYLHLFATEQADLNWENPAVRTAVKDVMAFWAEKGVDGFRLDVINLISKDQSFPDDHQGDGRRFYTDGPRVHEYLQEISRDIFQRYGSVTVGEMSSTTLEHCQQYSAPDGKELSMVFNFHHLKVDYPGGEKWRLAPFDFLALKQLFRTWQHGLHNQGWGALFWCNHDQPRVVSRFGDDRHHRVESAKMLATAIHMQQGTPYVYQGEEIGMTNPGYQHIDDYQDVESRNMHRLLCDQGMPEGEVLAILAARSRDNSRTPMQWNSSANAGFTQGTPWLKPAPNYVDVNVDTALADKDSVFYHYKQLISLRKTLPVIREGDYQDLLPDHPQLLAYRRDNGDSQLVVVCNFYGEPVTATLPIAPAPNADLVSHNYPEAKPLMPEMQLAPYEALVYLINPA
ncbi:MULTISPECIES: alpha,alpha-phosphotrehalase [unclassified Salinivibrio]|uniref:alpha,alpha-phosphotrehalase n=1 Tax=unclassified Salinivibrio TaxID=2636825 RepID=UPI0009867191|nr:MULTISPECIES: alpha,alpha-phosphotrehalase [unclassified Salinivibrio]OOE94027.1 alpha,alpha-phosphotrehalase [Salinivibrio sp. AR640]OOE94434.1 alpha,alpha-phosphotrehalase [Salinivibrio sp. AR647]